jgi:uncharacterized membrane protein/mono/diheme cytochrome c family protein
MIEFIARLHPALVHLPIGILLIACALQLLSLREKYASLQGAVSFTVFWGMIAAVFSCITGYLLSQSGEYDETLISQHQWLGITTAFVSLLFYLSLKIKRTLAFPWAMPTGIILLVALTGHLGGSLTHGSDYLSAAFESGGTDTIAKAKVIPNVQEAILYADIVQPILQQRCYGCHGASKQKGKLRMDQPDLLIKGGKDGPIIEPGKADASEMIKRILLEKTDEHHMPPKEKPQLSSREIAVLHWWIESGAAFDKKTKDIPQPDKIKAFLASYQKSEDKTPVRPPLPPVEAADPKAIQALQSMGVAVIPVAANANYLSLNAITAKLDDKSVSLLLPLKKQLLQVDLSGKKITDASLNTLGELMAVETLRLDSTQVTDKGLARLATLTNLRSLHLTGTNVSLTGLQSLSALRNLKNIYLYHSAIKGSDYPALKKLFPAASIDTGNYQVPLFETDTMLVKPPKRPA